MCGFSLYAGQNLGGHEVISLMSNAIAHRGPDFISHKFLQNCHLGHARLSIIDLEAGSQPMPDVDGRRWIVFNGEIYNYKELRDELTACGLEFRTHSDTEVILQAYAKWGESCVEKFRGMFAFAIWDSQTKSIFAARDLFGEKPLFYTQLQSGDILIASEIKGLLASNLIKPKLSTSSVDAYLTFGYVPPNQTIYENIAVLPPGSYFTWQKGGIKIQRYWAPKLVEEKISIEDASYKLTFLLSQAVKRQMVSDVPVGAFLSGGLDSSTIVALMRKNNSGPLLTFAAGFGDQINELPYARSVAEAYKTEHYELDFGNPNVADLLEMMATIYDEPFADTSNIPTFLISQYAKQHVKVVLTGDGGDEIFGGYWWYKPLSDSIGMNASWTKWAAYRMLAKFSKAYSRKAVALGWATRYKEVWTRDVMAHTVFKEKERINLWGNRRDIPTYSPATYYKSPTDLNDLNSGFYFDQTFYLPGDILTKVDRAAMANGLETRAPFLDRDLVEFAQTLPSNLKVQDGETKLLLRHACENLWPEKLRARNKQGFGAPSGAWLKRPDVIALINRVFKEGSPLRSLLPGVKIPTDLEPPYQTWTLLVLGLWLEKNKIII